MKRTFDLLFASLLMTALIIPMFIIGLIIRATSKGPALFWSQRIGRNNTLFYMPKFRTMVLGTPDVATHLLENPEQYVTSFGRFLRKYSLDELPQLWSILKGDMSFVGPRPALYNQNDLIELRTIKGVHELVPGITGWAQINGRDDLSIPVKIELDDYYRQNRSFLLDFKILGATIFKVLKTEGVRH